MKLKASVPIPVWDQNLGGITEAREARAKVEAERAASKAALILTLAKAYDTLAGAAREIELLRGSAMPNAQKAVDAIESGYARAASPCSKCSTRKARADAGGAARAGGAGELPYLRRDHRGPDRHAARPRAAREADDATRPQRRRPDLGRPAGGRPGALSATAVRRKGAGRRPARPRQARSRSRRGRRAERRESRGGRHRAGKGRTRRAARQPVPQRHPAAQPGERWCR